MKKFNVPILFRVRASSKEEANRVVHRLMSCMAHDAVNNEPELWDQLKHWSPAEIRSKK